MIFAGRDISVIIDGADSTADQPFRVPVPRFTSLLRFLAHVFAAALFNLRGPFEIEFPVRKLACAGVSETEKEC